jgi:uncharacterized protein (TIGR00297 family)
MNFLIGLVLSSAVAFPAYKKRKLSLSGCLGAIILGTGIYGFGSLLLWVMMIGFFLLSTLVSNRSKRKSEHAGRTYIQVLANGGLPMIFALLYFFTQFNIFLFTAVILFAGNNADTWGSEIGTKLKGKTYNIFTLKQVPIGLSGGVSIQGTIASALGSLIMASIYIITIFLMNRGLLIYEFWFFEFMLIFLLGFLNTLIDSYLGAVFQAKYVNQSSGRVDDEPQEKTDRLVGGFSWFTNDLVNTVSLGILSLITLFVLIA